MYERTQNNGSVGMLRAALRRCGFFLRTQRKGNHGNDQKCRHESNGRFHIASEKIR